MVKKKKSPLQESATNGLRMDRLSLSKDVVEPRHPSRTKVQSTQILSRNLEERELKREQMLEEERQLRVKKERQKLRRKQQWEAKTKTSPFQVNLLAENERIDEENRLRRLQAQKKEKLLQKRREKVKNDLILQALQDASELEALRKEKRAIQMEEKRLKALSDLEKTNSHRKTDLITAKKAEKQRLYAKGERRRKEHLDRLEADQQMYTKILAEKLDIQDKVHDGAFES